MRASVDRGSSGVLAIALFGAAVVLAMGGLHAARLLANMSGALRSAESAAVTVASRYLAGDPEPCAAPVANLMHCEVARGIARVAIEQDGFRATAEAGPER